MFRGNHPTRVDEKGRLKIPAEFKRVIDEKYGQQFYITSLDGKVASVSLRGVGADRAEAGRALHFQSYEEEVSGPGELLRADGGNGWAGAAADAATAARSGADQRRGCGYRQSDALDRAQPGFVPQVGRGRQVHA